MGLFDKLLGKFGLSWSGSYEDYYGTSDSEDVPASENSPQYAQERYTNIRQMEERWLETHYDFNSVSGIAAIPVSANLPHPTFGDNDGFRSYTGDVDYYLQRKAVEHEKAGNIDLAILCLRKSNDIRMIARRGYRRDDYYRLVSLLARSGKIREAETEKKRIDDFFSAAPGWDNDAALCIPANTVQAIVRHAASFQTDLVIMNVHGNSCPECAKYQGRVFSLSGSNKRFPKIPDVFWQYGAIHPGCGHSFHPFIEGVTDPDLKYTLDVHRGVKWRYTRNIEAFSNRPFVDDRRQEDIDSALSLMAKRKEEAERQQYRWDHYIEVEAERGADARKFKWLQENLPGICPKSLSGYRRMKTQNTKNFQKLVASAKALGVDL